MRIIAVVVVHDQQYLMKDDLSFVGYFQRPTVRELILETALHTAASLSDPERKVFRHDDAVVSCHRIGSRVAVLVTDLEYPSRVCFEILRRLHETPTPDQLETTIREYQAPERVDALTAIRHRLDETLIVMHENVNLVLQRGEDLDQLVERSARLSASSKMFYKAARKHNRCCSTQ